MAFFPTEYLNIAWGKKKESSNKTASPGYINPSKLCVALMRQRFRQVYCRISGMLSHMQHDK